MDLSFIESASYSAAPARTALDAACPSEASFDGAPAGLMMPPGGDVSAGARLPPHTHSSDRLRGDNACLFERSGHAPLDMAGSARA